MRIKIIVPITAKSFQENAQKEYGHYVNDKGSFFKDLKFDIEILPEGKGPLTIESEYDGALAEPGAIALAEKAEREGYDGVVIDCFCDAGYHPAREAVSIPVTGAFETSIRFAQLLGKNIAIVTMKKSFIPRIQRMAKAMGASGDIVSIRSVEIPVVDLGKHREKLKEGLVTQMLEAIEEDGAEVLVLGCTGMMGVASSVQKALNAKGYDVPVVNPAEVCLRFMECLLIMGVKQSGVSYPPKRRTK
jgi:allantoin racemase